MDYGKDDLQERLAVYGENVIRLARTIVFTPITSSLIDQLVRSSTSIGANYCEADNAESRKDFRHKISLCLKEAKETKHWLRMLAAAVPDKGDELRGLWTEAKQLTLIFAAIRRSTDANTQKP